MEIPHPLSAEPLHSFGEAVTAQFSGGTSGDTGVFTLYGRSSTDLPTLG